MNYFEMVKEFNETFGHEPIGSFSELTAGRHELRQTLNREEWKETVKAHAEGHEIGRLDGLVDMMYVICGHWWEVSKEAVDITPSSMGLKYVGHYISNLDFYYEKQDGKAYADHVLQIAKGTLFLAQIMFGVDVFSQAFAEVHRSNMAKLWTVDETIEAATKRMNKEGYQGWRFKDSPTGKGVIATRPDGKIMKAPSWTPPNLKQFLV